MIVRRSLGMNPVGPRRELSRGYTGLSSHDLAKRRIHASRAIAHLAAARNGAVHFRSRNRMHPHGAKIGACRQDPISVIRSVAHHKHKLRLIVERS